MGPVPPAPPACSKNLDLLFVLDGSGSILPNSWQIDLKATATIANSFKFGCSADPNAAEAEMGLIQFSDKVQVEQPLTCDKGQFLQSLNSTKKMGSFTYTGDALQVAAQEYEQHGRKGDYRAVILITDGVPCTMKTIDSCDNPDAEARIPDPEQATKAQQWAQTLKSDGAVIISIAVGDFGTRGLQFIDQISSTPSSRYVFNPDS